MEIYSYLSHTPISLRYTHITTYTHMEHTNKHTYEHTDKPTDKHTYEQTDKPTDKHTYEHTDKPTDKHTYEHTYIYIYTPTEALIRHTCLL